MVEQLATSVSRRSALKVFAGAATAVAGSALLAACGASGSTATNSSGSTTGGTKSSAAAPAAAGLKLVAGTAGTAKWITLAGTTMAMVDRGDDCWGSADTCTYADMKGTGDGTWSVQVTALGNTNAWEKGGIMARSALDPTSADVFLAVTDGNGVVLQYREATGDNEGSVNGDNDSVLTTANGGVAPIYLKLQKQGDNWTGWTATDGKTWQNQVAATQNPVVLGANYLVGLAATAHDNTQHGNVTFANITGFTGALTMDLVGTNDTVAAP